MKKKQPGTFSRTKAKSSDPMVIKLAPSTSASGKTRRATEVTCADTSDWLIVAGVRRWISISASHPIASATERIVLLKRSRTSSRTAGSNVRIVPVISTAGGITLNVSPAWILQTLTTAVCKGGTLRATIPCRAVITWADARMGSTAKCGAAPWPPFPRILMLKISAPAIAGPLAIPIHPTGFSFQTCRAKAMSTLGLANIPASIIASAPPIPSSAGWNINLTVPASSFWWLFSILATVSSIPVWPSCPQACMTPRFWDA